MSATLASPIGYTALKYISYPMVILVKSSKPVPVMAVGVLFYGRVYTWCKYVSVMLLTVGICLFSSTKKSSGAGGSFNESNDLSVVLFGMLLVLINLGMDGYTNNEQDRIFTQYGASPNQMMQFVNLWQCLYQLLYLAGGYAIYAQHSELSKSLFAMIHSPPLCLDIFLFCVCACVGQVLIFNVMREFGSLAWITISVTRKLFTLVMSVFVFGHPVNAMQWLGVLAVFLGLSVDAAVGFYLTGNKIDTCCTKGKEN